MRGLRRFGDYFLEFIVVTLIGAVAAVTVIAFFPVTVGLTGFFSKGIEDRAFKDIFRTIGQNWKIIIFYTIFQLIIIVFPVLNIYFFNTHPQNLNGFVLAVSYIALVFGAIYMTTAPTIIVNMNVTFRQLLYNGFMLLFGGLVRSVIAVACVAGVIAIILYLPYLAIATLYVVPFITTYLMGENFYKLKARKLGVTVEELKKKDVADNYLDEFGKIIRSEDGCDQADGEGEDENE